MRGLAAYAARDRGVNSSGGLVNTRPSRSPIQLKRRAPVAGSVPLAWMLAASRASWRASAMARACA